MKSEEGTHCDLIVSCPMEGSTTNNKSTFEKHLSVLQYEFLAVHEDSQTGFSGSGWAESTA
jgi:hypothetical protein